MLSNNKNEAYIGAAIIDDCNDITKVTVSFARKVGSQDNVICKQEFSVEWIGDSKKGKYPKLATAGTTIGQDQCTIVYESLPKRLALDENEDTWTNLPPYFNFKLGITDKGKTLKTSTDDFEIKIAAEDKVTAATAATKKIRFGSVADSEIQLNFVRQNDILSHTNLYSSTTNNNGQTVLCSPNIGTCKASTLCAPANINTNAVYTDCTSQGWVCCSP